ncbi:MAG: hypothetical protein P8Y63_01185 [Deltaproteobacteria bacterium]
MLQGPIEQQAGLGTINEEIRRHVKAMGSKERHEFLEEANAKGDTKTMTAVLGALHYLTGILPTEHDYYLREFHMRRNLEAAKRLKVMKAALALLEKRAPLIFGKVEKAIGQPWRRVQLLRKTNNEAEQAFIIRDNNAV